MRLCTLFLVLFGGSTLFGTVAPAPHLPQEFSMWQLSSPVVDPDATEIPPVTFSNVWYYDGPNKRLLLRTKSPNGTSYVLHRGDVAPARMYFYDTAALTCAGIDLPIGPPRPDWLEGNNGSYITDVFIKTASGSFRRTQLWCKPDVPGWTPFCSYWADGELVRLTAPPGGPGVPSNKLILNEYSNFAPGPQNAELFEVPSFCAKSTGILSHAMWSTLPYPYSSPSGADMIRAHQRVPQQQYKATTPQAVARVLNAHLERMAPHTIACEEWTLASLNALSSDMLDQLQPELDTFYRERKDRRSVRAQEDAVMHREAERALEAYHQSLPDRHSQRVLDTVRSGKCAELVLWYVHHLTATVRASWMRPIPKLALMGAGAFPQLPQSHPLAVTAELLQERYKQQSVCLHCHFAPGPEETPRHTA